MKNIVIAAGYATRLGELTKNFPKPLLKIGENTILGRMLDDIDQIPDIDEHIIVTNHKFAPIFEEWVKGLHYTKPITIVDDGTETNDTRLGAVCDLLLAIEYIEKVQPFNCCEATPQLLRSDISTQLCCRSTINRSRPVGSRCRQPPLLQLPGVRRLRQPKADLLHHALL